jgi:hypothetical protein
MLFWGAKRRSAFAFDFSAARGEVTCIVEHRIEHRRLESMALIAFPF